MTKRTPYDGQSGDYPSSNSHSASPNQQYEQNYCYNQYTENQQASQPLAYREEQAQAQSYHGSNYQIHQPYSPRYQEVQGLASATYPYLAQSSPHGGEAQLSEPYTQAYGQEEYAPPEGPPPQHQQSSDPANENEKGFMGAVAGGAAGAYAGHKAHHGFLGGIGGAVAGSMLQDSYKKHKQEKKEAERLEHEQHRLEHEREKEQRRLEKEREREQRRQEQEWERENQQRHHHDALVFQGNFIASSHNVRIEDHSVLVADCINRQGHPFRSTIDLNHCLANSWGRLVWTRGGLFADSSRNIRVVDGGSVLEAELDDGNGHWVPNRLSLNERITNTDGCLEMVD